MNNEAKFTTVDDVLRHIDEVLDKEINLLGTWIIGDGSHKCTYVEAMRRNIEYLQEQRQKFKTG